MALHRKFNGELNAFQYAVVFDAMGKAVPISRFWKEQTAVLVFLRHFGCAACRQHARDPSLKALGGFRHGASRLLHLSGTPEGSQSEAS